ADCLKRRPRDPAVWRARLDWARAAARVDIAEQALALLPAGRMEPAEALELRAWFAGQRDDREAECLALEHLIVQDPGNARALERLATLAFEAGRSDRAAELHRRKAEVDRTRDHYRKLLAVDVTTVDLPAVARLAEALGRWFEARGWWSLVARRAPADREPRDALERLARHVDPRPAGRSLTDLIAAPDRARTLQHPP